MFTIFRNVFIRCIKKQRVLVLLCAFGLLVSTSLLCIIQMIDIGREHYAENNSKVLNHGDLAVGFLVKGKTNLTQLEQVKIQLNNYLKTMDGIDYTYESICSNDDNFFYVNSDSYSGLAPVIRFVDFSKIDFFTDEIDGALSENDMVIAKNITNRCSVGVGDSVYVSPVGKVFPMKMKVSDIVLNKEILIQDAVENSYVFLDRKSIYKALQITPEYLEKIGYSEDDFCFTLPTYFYINGNEAAQNSILDQLKSICNENGVNFNQLLISKAEEAPQRISEVYGYMDVLLSIFTLLNFIISCFIICYLVYLLLNQNIQDINILKIFGLSQKKASLLILGVVLFCFLIPIILGIVVGYFVMHTLVRETSLFGLVQIGVPEVLKTSIQVLIEDIFAILISTSAVIFCASKNSIVDILRKDKMKPMGKLQACLVCFCIASFIFIIFSIFTSVSTTAVFLGSILVLGILLYMLALLVIKLTTFIHIKHRFELSIYFFKRNSAKVALFTVPITVAITIMYMIITLTQTLLNEADQYLEKNKGYNIQIMTTDSGKKKLDSYLSQEGISDYFSQYDSWCTIKSINGAPIECETTVSIYTDIPKVSTMNALKDGAIISEKMARTANLKVGDTLKIETETGTQDIKIASTYKEDTLNNFQIALLDSEGVVESSLTNYYLLLNDDASKNVKEFVNKNDDIIMISPSKMIFGIASIFIDNKAVIYLLDAFFFIGVVILVFYSVIILYQGRLNEFVIYQVLGKTKRQILIDTKLECLGLGIITSICGVLSSLLFTYIIGKYSLPITVNVKLLLVIIFVALAVMFLALLAIKRVLGSLKEDLSTILRQNK